MIAKKNLFFAMAVFSLLITAILGHYHIKGEYFKAEKNSIEREKIKSEYKIGDLNFIEEEIFIKELSNKFEKNEVIKKINRNIRKEFALDFITKKTNEYYDGFLNKFVLVKGIFINNYNFKQKTSERLKKEVEILNDIRFAKSDGDYFILKNGQVVILINKDYRQSGVMCSYNYKSEGFNLMLNYNISLIKEIYKYNKCKYSKSIKVDLGKGYYLSYKDTTMKFNPLFLEEYIENEVKNSFEGYEFIVNKKLLGVFAIMLLIFFIWIFLEKRYIIKK
tara:strand:- start:162 stop:992 length:831 start_codon:yes stop_codon:yes gene_type:complete